MINYAVDEKLLRPYLPRYTEIDWWENTCYVSLVGFMFLNTRIKGIRIPFHANFEEVNLRFYVRYKSGEEWKRGVVFIKEIVPRPALTFVANTIYQENYETMPMRHQWTANDALTVEYEWKKENWDSIKVSAGKGSKKIEAGSEEKFITEHYWGYTRINEQRTAEYEVVHPKWEVYPTMDYSIDVDFGNVYDKQFEFLKSEVPRSVFLAEGSEIKVLEGRSLHEVSN